MPSLESRVRSPTPVFTCTRSLPLAMKLATATNDKFGAVPVTADDQLLVRHRSPSGKKARLHLHQARGRHQVWCQ